MIKKLIILQIIHVVMKVNRALSSIENVVINYNRETFSKYFNDNIFLLGHDISHLAIDHVTFQYRDEFIDYDKLTNFNVLKLYDIIVSLTRCNKSINTIIDKMNGLIYDGVSRNINECYKLRTDSSGHVIIDYNVLVPDDDSDDRLTILSLMTNIINHTISLDFELDGNYSNRLLEYLSNKNIVLEPSYFIRYNDMQICFDHSILYTGSNKIDMIYKGSLEYINLEYIKTELKTLNDTMLTILMVHLDTFNHIHSINENPMYFEALDAILSYKHYRNESK